MTFKKMPRYPYQWNSLIFRWQGKQCVKIWPMLLSGWNLSHSFRPPGLICLLSRHEMKLDVQEAIQKSCLSIWCCSCSYLVDWEKWFPTSDVPPKSLIWTDHMYARWHLVIPHGDDINDLSAWEYWYAVVVNQDREQRDEVLVPSSRTPNWANWCFHTKFIDGKILHI